jgi:hypothetical protein
MALISIPTSIGGVTIPGAAVNGPLGALYSNVFGSNTLQYPRDLQSSTRGHYIHFTIREVSPVTYEQFKTASSSIFDNLGSNLTSLFNTVKDVATGNANSTGLNFQPKREKIVGNVFLYMPDTINFQYNAQYTDTSVLEMGQKMFSGLGKGVPIPKALDTGLSTVSNTIAAFGQAGLSKAGYAVNPQMQLLFQGIGFREYQMSFIFTPYSQQEAQQVQKIIKMFRTNAAPKIVTESGGMFFIPPSSFTLDFLFNGQTNPFISKVAESVITGVDVNYSPNGFSAHDDGSPVQTTLTLQFKEIQLVDKTKIQQGY